MPASTATTMVVCWAVHLWCPHSCAHPGLASPRWPSAICVQLNAATPARQVLCPASTKHLHALHTDARRWPGSRWRAAPGRPADEAAWDMAFLSPRLRTSGLEAGLRPQNGVGAGASPGGANPIPNLRRMGGDGGDLAPPPTNELSSFRAPRGLRAVTQHLLLLAVLHDQAWGVGACTGAGGVLAGVCGAA